MFPLSQTGLLQCKKCPKGKFASFNGQGDCEACPAGTFQDQEGRSECQYCPSGSYSTSSSATACTQCPFAHASTKESGSRSPVDCGCSVGYYYKCLAPALAGTSWPNNASCLAATALLQNQSGLSFCSTCPDRGMKCPGGLLEGYHAQPVALPGYSIIPTEPYGSYQCATFDEVRSLSLNLSLSLSLYLSLSISLSISLSLCLYCILFLTLYRRQQVLCPGGPANSPRCGLGHDVTAPACSLCPEGFFESAGACQQCATQSVWYDVTVLSLFIVGWCMIFIKSSQMDSPYRVFAELLCTLGVILRALSVIYIISSTRKTASGNPMGSLGTFLQQILTQFTVLRPTCSMGRSFASRYLSRIITLLALVGMGWFARFGRPVLSGDFHVVTHAKMLNVLGLLVSGLYILITKSIVLIFECRQNPNGLHTMTNFPDILCSSSERQAVLPVGVVLVIIFVIGFPMMIGLAVYYAPKVRGAARNHISLHSYNQLV